MYTRIKNILVRAIPRKLLFKYEYSLRFFYYLIYTGSLNECPICEKEVRKFISSSDDKICPRCGSLSRTRRLWALLNSGFLNPELSILDFSPSRSIHRVFKKNKYNYTSSDLSGDFISDVAYDITNIDSPDESYNLIICYHILEHIEDDNKAMKELYRVLTNDGACIIQTPFKEGEIYENFSIQSPEERTIHFGQDDHVRIYSAEGLKERLMKVGFKVEVRKFKDEVSNKFGFQENETILICKK